MLRNNQGKFLKQHKLATKPIAIRVDMDTYDQWQNIPIDQRPRLIKQAVNGCNDRHTKLVKLEVKEKIEIIANLKTKIVELQLQLKNKDRLITNLQTELEQMNQLVISQNSLIEQMRQSNIEKTNFINRHLNNVIR